MYLLSFRALALGVFALQSGLSNAATSDAPCTVHSTSQFYDLRKISLSPPDLEKSSKNLRTDSWQSKGYDYNANFSMNVCSPVLEDVKDVVGVDESQWRNVSAYYKKDGKTYSIGQESSNITVRGRLLVLQYTNGSPCGPASSKSLSTREESEGTSESSASEDRDADGQRRKSTTISFHCERESLTAVAAVSFVGTDPDECSYFFEVRSAEACSSVAPQEASLSPGGVFGVIVVIAVVVYFVGGIMYQRSVAHARGWRQLPNYSLWAGIGSFFKDMFIIGTSSCANLLPRRRGYISVSANSSGGTERPDDENRLIDQLDEEWDD